MMLSSSVEVPSPGGMSVAAARNVVRSSSISGAMYSLEKSPSSSGPDATGITGNKKRRSSLGAKMVAIVGLSQWSKSTLQLNQQVLFSPSRVETLRGGSGGPVGEREGSGRVAALCDSPVWAIDTSLQLLSALILLHCLTLLCHLRTATDPGLEPHAGAYGRVAVPCYNIAPPRSSGSLCQPGTYATLSVSMETAGPRHVFPLPLGSDEHGCQKELSVFFTAGLLSNLMEKAC
ncbi:hypothetical protein AOLI_G00301380 [Acnodon oligacanthus]